MNNNRLFAHSSCASGIDKLVLTTQSFIIKDASNTGLQVKHGFTDLATGEQKNPFLFMDKTGRKVDGISAFFNTEQYGLNINQFGLQVIFNPSKPYHPFNLCSNMEVLQERIETSVIKDLEKKGIRIDIEDSKISRLDIARNGIMKEPCIAYNPVLSWLNIPRSKRDAMYPDGHSSNNNNFGINFYNKGKELRQDGIEIIPDDNTMRCELQYKGTKSVCNKAGITTLASLYEAGGEHIHKIYTDTLSENVFKAGQSNQLQISYSDTKEFLIDLKKDYGRRAIEVFYSSYGIGKLIQELGSINAFVNLLHELGYHRNTINKHKKRAIEFLNIQKQIKKTSGIDSLYKELYLKFAS